LLTLAKDAKEWGVITSLPNFTQLFPSAVRSGTATGLLEGSVSSSAITMKSAGAKAKVLDPGKYLVIVKDNSKKDDFVLKGPSITKSSGVAKTGTVRWTVTLAPGRYTYSSSKHPKLRGSFKVS
jgi:hypothetical protein